MKSITNRFFVFAALALSLGTLAYGQSTLKANVPFAFAAPGGPAGAGQYTIKVEDFSDGKFIHISSLETGHSVLSQTRRLADPINGAVTPHLLFRCGEEGCQLSEIWTPAGGYTVTVSHGRNPQYLAYIPLTVSQN